MAGTTTAPDGREWTVRRRWAPRLGTDSAWDRFLHPLGWTFRRLKKRKGSGVFDLGGITDFGDDLLGVLLFVVVVLVAFFVAIPLLVAIIDLLIILLLAGLGVLTRIAFRRPWLVEARADDETTHSWNIVGWRTSGEKIAEIKQLLMSGIEPQ